jgi:creatinine amidohydrolase
MSMSTAFGDLTYQEIRKKADAGCLAVLATGCTEQQGPHLPVSFDTWLATAVAHGAAEQAAHRYGVDVLVLPTLPFGPTLEHRNFGSGNIHLTRELHEAVVSQVLVSLAIQGFRRIVVWRGCGGHDLHQAVARFNEQYAGRACAFLPDLPYHEIWCRIGDPSNPGGHADAFATSLALHLRPEMVRAELIANLPQSAVDWSDPDLDFARYSASGVIGDPTTASAELGAKLWVAVVSEVARTIRDLAEK